MQEGIISMDFQVTLEYFFTTLSLYVYNNSAFFSATCLWWGYAVATKVNSVGYLLKYVACHHGKELQCGKGQMPFYIGSPQLWTLVTQKM